MSEKFITFALSAMLIALSSSAEAQQPTKVPRVAYVTGASLSAMEYRIEAFRQGLRELGYVEGKNVIIVLREAEGKLDHLPALMAELMRDKVDIIVAAGSAVTRPAKEVTSTIPIVMAQDPDPVANGFVASLARPGGNITGLSTFRPEISGKRLELLKEVVPKLSRVAVFGTSTTPDNTQALKETELAAGALKVQLQYVDVLDRTGFESAFRAAVKERADAVLWMVSGALTTQRARIVDMAVKSRLPVIYGFHHGWKPGGL